MKNVEQIQREIPYGDIMPIRQFINDVDDGYFNDYDGIGFLHDGDNKTEIQIYCNVEWLKAHQNYPYVCWYNK